MWPDGPAGAMVTRCTPVTEPKGQLTTDQWEQDAWSSLQRGASQGARPLTPLTLAHAHQGRLVDSTNRPSVHTPCAPRRSSNREVRSSSQIRMPKGRRALWRWTGARERVPGDRGCTALVDAALRGVVLASLWHSPWASNLRSAPLLPGCVSVPGCRSDAPSRSPSATSCGIHFLRRGGAAVVEVIF